VELEVRPIAPNEMEHVLPLIAGYQRFYRAEPDDERNRRFFARFIEPSEDGLLLGAWDGEELVGFATLYWTFSSTVADDVVLMNDLFVAPGRRGRGIGRALTESARAITRQRGAHHLEWLTAEDNETAQRLYDSTGAERSSWLGYELDP
jgi:ribosomal protein S18 acetylase RimI-like enzyme